MTYIILLVTFFAAAWVFFDARERGKGIIVAFLWCLGTQLLPIIDATAKVQAVLTI